MAAPSPFIHDWFSDVAAKNPEATAIECGDRRVSYSALETRSNQLANRLLAGGKGAGQRVVIFSADIVAVMTAILATLKAGGVFVPLDVHHPAARIEAVLAEVSPDLLVVDRPAAPRMQPLVPNARVATTEDEPISTTRPDIRVEPDAPCYIYFSSGSTGGPKGIVGRLKAIAHFIDWEMTALGVGPGIRVSQLTTPSFDAFLRDMFVPLCAGGTACVPERREDILDSRAFVAWLEDQQISLLHCVPSLFSTLLREPLTSAHFLDLRHILLAGEVLPPGAVDRWMAVFGERIRLVNLYGPSETTMIKFAHFVRQEDRARRSIPIGRPIDGAEALLIDGQGRVCPPNVVGEIYIRTPYSSLGYLNRPDLTAAAFVQNPASDVAGDLVYRTGDLGRELPDGTYEFVGRVDTQVKIRGVLVDLAEIEETLRGHGAVAEVVAAMLADSEGNPRLYAYATLRADASGEALRNFLAEKLPAEMVPAGVIVLDAMPRTISGKPDRQALPAPDLARAAASNGAAPQTETEKRLAAIWAGVLGVECVGRHDDFFKIGGHSLLAMSVISRTSSAFETQIPLRHLFEGPTIAAFAQHVDALCRDAAVRAPAEGLRVESGEL